MNEEWPFTSMNEWKTDLVLCIDLFTVLIFNIWTYECKKNEQGSLIVMFCNVMKFFLH